MLRCGLLGRTLGHSYSPQIHRRLGDYEYRLYEKEPEEVDAFLKSGEFDGLNVTIPYKKTVIPYCTELSDAAKTIGSVNTLVRRKDGTLYGDNTDAAGLLWMVRRLGVDIEKKKCLVCGSGGASLTAQAVLHKCGAGEIIVLSRSGPEGYENLSRHADAALLVNTTPLGMYPNAGKSPVDLQDLPNLAGVLDVVYNPARTRLLLDAEERSIPACGGLWMLVEQARRAAELWTGAPVPDTEVERIFCELRRETLNLVLVGMPGCGKTTLGALSAKQLGRTLADADEAVERRTGKPIPAIFEAGGEEAFRREETAALAELGQRSSLVLATGGGCVTREENHSLLHQNGVIIHITRPAALLPREGRPLSQGTDLTAMWAKRAPLYRRFADAEIENTGTPDEAVQKILEAFYEISGHQRA
mgnify:FL=1